MLKKINQLCSTDQFKLQHFNLLFLREADKNQNCVRTRSHAHKIYELEIYTCTTWIFRYERESVKKARVPISAVVYP